MDWFERVGWAKRYADREMEDRMEELKSAGLDPKSLPGYMFGVAIAYTGHFLHGLFKDIGELERYRAYK
jgi:hypothetical protein